MDRRKFLGTVAGAATAVAAPRLALGQASKMSVLLGTAPPDPACHYYYYAQAKGFYKEAGLDVEIKPIGAETMALRALAGERGRRRLVRRHLDLAGGRRRLQASRAVMLHAEARLSRGRAEEHREPERLRGPFDGGVAGRRGVADRPAADGRRQGRRSEQGAVGQCWGFGRTLAVGDRQARRRRADELGVRGARAEVRLSPRHRRRAEGFALLHVHLGRLLGRGRAEEARAICRLRRRHRQRLPLGDGQSRTRPAPSAARCCPIFRWARPNTPPPTSRKRNSGRRPACSTHKVWDFTVDALVKLGNIKEKMKYDELVLADVVADAEKKK